MTRQTGRGQSTPSLATKKILQGHHSDGPAEGARAGRGGRAEGFHQEPWPHCIPAAVPRPSGSQACWGLNRAQLERPAALPMGGVGAASFPSWDQQDYRRAPGWGQKGQRAPNQGKGSGCGEAEGRLGAGGGRPRCS